MNKCSRASLCSVAKAATVILVVSCCAYAPQSLACSCNYLAYGFIGPHTSRLPANAIGIPWYVSTKAAHYRGEEDWFVVDEGRFSLEVLNKDQFVPIPLRITVAQEFTTDVDTYMIHHISPMDGGLMPGATYRVLDRLKTELRTVHGGRGVVVEIDHETLSADTPLILHVGNTKISGGLSVAANMSCTGWLTVSQARIAAWLPRDFRKWEDQLLFRTIVDGEPWQVRSALCSVVEPGRGWDGVAHDRIFAACEEPSFSPISPVLAPGRHTVEIEARLPGTDVVLRTEKRTVNLECSEQTSTLEGASY